MALRFAAIIMSDNLQSGQCVLCLGTSGYVYEYGHKAVTRSHFPINAVGFVRETGASESLVFIIGRNDAYVLKNHNVRVFDPTKTGKGYDRKTCNKCHVLKDHADFEQNQTNAKGRTTTRPSCRVYRLDIDRRTIPSAVIRAMNKHRPQKGSLFRCPICEKRSIAYVTANIVLDHDHAKGKTRLFICDSCNTGLGRFKNGENYLRNAIAYLEEFGEVTSERVPHPVL